RRRTQGGPGAHRRADQRGLGALALRAAGRGRPEHPPARGVRADERAADAVRGDHRRGRGDGEALRGRRHAAVRQRDPGRDPGPRTGREGEGRATRPWPGPEGGRPVSDEETGAPVPGWPEESQQRLEKARALRALGVDPYPRRFERSHTFAQIVEAHGAKTAEDLEKEAPAVRVAGRVILKRPMGKASFATLSDGERQLQIYVRKDDVGDKAYEV